MRFHGTESMYTGGCRSRQCKAAHNAYNTARYRIKHGAPKPPAVARLTKVDRLVELAFRRIA